MDLTSAIELTDPPRMVPERFKRGMCMVAQISSPFQWGPTFGLRCYAVLAGWLPAEAPVGMYLTVHGNGEVHRLFAADELRGPATNDRPSAPKRVGRWMFEQGLFTRHSRDRSPAGDSWAEFVGGELPPISHAGPPDESEAIGQAVLALINHLPWSTLGAAELANASDERTSSS